MPPKEEKIGMFKLQKVVDDYRKKIEDAQNKMRHSMVRQQRLRDISIIIAEYIAEEDKYGTEGSQWVWNDIIVKATNHMKAPLYDFGADMANLQDYLNLCEDCAEKCRELQHYTISERNPNIDENSDKYNQAVEDIYSKLYTLNAGVNKFTESLLNYDLEKEEFADKHLSMLRKECLECIANVDQEKLREKIQTLKSESIGVSCSAEDSAMDISENDTVDNDEESVDEKVFRLTSEDNISRLQAKMQETLESYTKLSPILHVDQKEDTNERISKFRGSMELILSQLNTSIQLQKQQQRDARMKDLEQQVVDLQGTLADKDLQIAQLSQENHDLKSKLEEPSKDLSGKLKRSASDPASYGKEVKTC